MNLEVHVPEGKNISRLVDPRVRHTSRGDIELTKIQTTKGGVEPQRVERQPFETRSLGKTVQLSRHAAPGKASPTETFCKLEIHRPRNRGAVENGAEHTHLCG
jgi:hypothetical protein